MNERDDIQELPLIGSGDPGRAQWSPEGLRRLAAVNIRERAYPWFDLREFTTSLEYAARLAVGQFLAVKFDGQNGGGIITGIEGCTVFLRPCTVKERRKNAEKREKP